MRTKERDEVFKELVRRKGKWRSRYTDKVVEVLGVEGVDPESGDGVMWARVRLQHESGRVSRKAAHYFCEEYVPVNRTSSVEGE